MNFLALILVTHLIRQFTVQFGQLFVLLTIGIGQMSTFFSIFSQVLSKRRNEVFQLFIFLLPIICHRALSRKLLFKIIKFCKPTNTYEWNILLHEILFLPLIVCLFHNFIIGYFDSDCSHFIGNLNNFGFGRLMKTFIFFGSRLSLFGFRFGQINSLWDNNFYHHLFIKNYHTCLFSWYLFRSSACAATSLSYDSFRVSRLVL